MKTAVTEPFLSEYAPASPVDDTGISIHQATDIFALWEALEAVKKQVCDPPFWAVAWPGARFLAQYLLKNSSIVAGKTVLDIGAGCGIASIAALRAGAASATVNDIDEDALFVATLNAATNGVALSTDNRDLSFASGKPYFDVVLVCDMFYDLPSSRNMLNLLEAFRKDGAEVIIVDGCRPFTPRNRITPIVTATLPVSLVIEGVAERRTTLYRMG